MSIRISAVKREIIMMGWLKQRSDLEKVNAVATVRKSKCYKQHVKLPFVMHMTCMNPLAHPFTKISRLVIPKSVTPWMSFWLK